MYSPTRTVNLLAFVDWAASYLASEPGVGNLSPPMLLPRLLSISTRGPATLYMGELLYNIISNR